MSNFEQKTAQARFNIVKRTLFQRLSIKRVPNNTLEPERNHIVLANHLDLVSEVASKNRGIRRQLHEFSNSELISFLEGHLILAPGHEGLVHPSLIRNQRIRDIVIKPEVENELEDPEEVARRRNKIIAWRGCLNSAKAVREDGFRRVLEKAALRRKIYPDYDEQQDRLRNHLRRFQREPRIFDFIRTRTHQLFDLQEYQPQRRIPPGRQVARDPPRQQNPPIRNFLQNFFGGENERAVIRIQRNPQQLGLAPAAGGNVGLVIRPRQNNFEEQMMWIRPHDQRIRRERSEAQRQRQQHVVISETPYECDMCGGKPLTGEFFRHYWHCKKTTNASKLTQKHVLADYFQSEYVLHKMFQELSDELEMDYYVGVINPEDQCFSAACTLCESFEEHQAGKCFQDSLVAAFKQRGKLIINELIAHLTHHLLLERQDGLDEIEDRHNDHFSLLEERFSTDLSDEEVEAQRERDWYEFRKTTINDQSREKQKYLMEITECDRKDVVARHSSLHAELLKYISLVSTTVRMNTEADNMHVARALVRMFYREQGKEVPEGLRVKDEMTGDPPVDIDLELFFRGIPVKKKAAKKAEANKSSKKEEEEKKKKKKADEEDIPLKKRWKFSNPPQVREPEVEENAHQDEPRQQEAVNSVQQRLDMLEVLRD